MCSWSGGLDICCSGTAANTQSAGTQLSAVKDEEGCRGLMHGSAAIKGRDTQGARTRSASSCGTWSCRQLHGHPQLVSHGRTAMHQHGVCASACGVAHAQQRPCAVLPSAPRIVR